MLATFVAYKKGQMECVHDNFLNRINQILNIKQLFLFSTTLFHLTMPDKYYLQQHNYFCSFNWVVVKWKMFKFKQENWDVQHLVEIKGHEIGAYKPQRLSDWDTPGFRR